MKRLALLIIAAALLAPAQETAELVKQRQPGARYIQRLYQVKHVDTEDLVRLVYTAPSGQGQTPVVRSSPALKAITVYGTVDEVTSIMENLKALDVPRPGVGGGPRSFELTMYALVAGLQSDLPGAPVPESLNGVTAQLRKVFGLTQFKLVEASVLRASTSSRNRQRWDGFAGTFGGYRANFDRAQVDGAGSSAILRLDDFSFELGTQKGRVVFGTNLELKEGQQVVVGKANVDGADKSLVLVLTASVDK